jgi:hypothetical protein
MVGLEKCEKKTNVRYSTHRDRHKGERAELSVYGTNLFEITSIEKRKGDKVYGYLKTSRSKVKVKIIRTKWFNLHQFSPMFSTRS